MIALTMLSSSGRAHADPLDARRVGIRAYLTAGAAIGLAACGRVGFDPVVDGAPSSRCDPGRATLTVPAQYVPTGSSGALAASGGTPPYTFELVSGVGTVDAAGTFMAPSAITANSEVAVVQACDASGATGLGNVTVAVSGTLDTTFGAAGIQLVSLTSGDAGFGITVEPDGKLMIVGTAETYSSMLLLRLSSNGVPDPTFGTSGTGAITFHLGTSTTDLAFSIARRADGRFMLGGQTQLGASGGLAIVSLTPDGTLDGTFGPSGVGYATASIGAASDDVPGAAFTPDGSIVAVGHTQDGQLVFIAKLTAAGMPDATFGSSGVATLPITSGAVTYGVLPQPDGKVVGCGAANGMLLLFRFDAAGVLDPSFGTGGVIQDDLSPGMASQAHGCALLGDGHIVATVNYGAGTAGFARYTSAGARDLTYGTSGLSAALAAQADGMTVDARGRAIVVAHPSSGDGFSLARVLEDGGPDPTFAAGGLDTFNLGPANEFGLTVTVAPDGALLASGFAGNELGILRIWP